jgi:hypothetical protein
MLNLKIMRVVFFISIFLFSKSIVMGQIQFTKNGIEGYELGKDFKELRNIKPVSSFPNKKMIDCMQISGYDYYYLDSSIYLMGLGNTICIVIAVDEQKVITDTFIYLKDRDLDYKGTIDNVMGKQKLETQSSFATAKSSKGFWVSDEFVKLFTIEEKNNELEVSIHLNYSYDKPTPYVGFRFK